MSTTDGRPYRTSRWAKCRALQLGREPMCQGCETKAAEHVDHIIPVKRGGAFWKSSNWQSLCHGCHTDKTNAERSGLDWTPPKWRGCFPDGSPRDPRHPWHTGGGSITADPSHEPAPYLRKELAIVPNRAERR